MRRIMPPFLPLWACYVGFMRRPRSHDVLIVSALVALIATGVWALWWDDVRGFLHLAPTSGSAAPASSSQPIELPRT
jgi:hypothetical protein